MDNAQKAIMIGVGLFITIIIISAVMLITSAGQDMVDDSMGKLSDISTQLSSTERNSLDGKYMNGSQVIAYVKKYYDSTSFLCYYESTNGTFVRASRLKSGEVSATKYTNVVKTTEVEANTDFAKIGDLTNVSEPKKYVSATSTYQANLITTTAGDPVGVIFLKN